NVDAIVVATRDDVALALVVDALAVGADPVAGCAGGDHDAAAESIPLKVANRLGAVIQRDGARYVRPDQVAGDGIAAAPLPGDPDGGKQVTTEQVPLGRVINPVPVGPDQVLVGPSIDLDPGVIRLSLRSGRIGAEEVAVDPVAGGAGARDVNAGALAEIG